MSRSDFGAKAEIISRLTDPQQLTAMLKNPQYAGFTSVIIARLTEINQMKQGAQGQQPQAPTVAQQAVQGQAPQPQAAPQPPPGMSRGGIVAFKQGGEVRKFGEGGAPENPAARRRAELLRRAQDIIPNPMRAVADVAGIKLKPVEVRRTQVAPENLGIMRVDNSQPVEDPRTRLQSAPPTDQQKQAGDTRTGLPLSQQQLFGKDTSGISGTTSSGIKAGTPGEELSKYYSGITNLLGPNRELESQRAELQKDKADNINFALMHAGLGMAQAGAEHPTHGFLGNLATGAGEGLGSFEKSAATRQAGERELGRLDRAERLGLAGLAVNERGQDVRALRNEALQRQQLSLQSQMYKQPYIDHQMTMALATELANADIDPQTGKPRHGGAYYYGQAKPVINSGMYGANARGATATRGQYEKELSDFRKEHIGDKTAFFPSYEAWQSQRGLGGTSPAPTHIIE